MAKNQADRYTDKSFSQLESQISRMYKEAQKDINQKLADFTKRHRAKDQEMKRKLKRGEITQDQYDKWMIGQVFVGNQWKQKKEQITESVKHVMQEASNVSRGKAIDVFAENANHTAFEIEKDLGAQINFGLYDADTVSRLIRDEPELLPRKVVKGKKLEAWNQKVIANSISQGIIQGESIDEISKRIARDTCISAGRSSMLYARTAITGAQNAGRLERLHEAKDMGINVKKRWMATLDNRTRDSHADLDGETVDVDEKFSNGLEYPGDPNGAGREVYNCRCTLVYIYPEYEQHFERTAYYEEGDPEYDPKHRNYETVRDMTYEQWVEYKQNQIRARYGGEPIPVPELEETITQRIKETITPERDKFVIPSSVRESVDAESASEDWFEYENANAMREYIQTGNMPISDLNGEEFDNETRQRLAAEAELIQKTGEKTKTTYKTLYRGMVVDEDEVRSMFTPGEMYNFDTITATATDKGVAAIYSNTENSVLDNGVPVILEIQKPDGIYGFDRDGTEVVIPKGSEFKVIKNWMDNKGVVHISLYSKKGRNVGRRQ